MTTFPIDPRGLLSPAAAAALAGLLAQWLKAYLREWRYTNLLVLVLAVATELAAMACAGGGDWWGAVWAGLLGASVATFGYETIQNLGALAGLGGRTEVRLNRADAKAPREHEARGG